jgi:predicted phosphodiesterase
MEIRYMSDLHLEFGKFRMPKLDNDENTVLVLAGDIAVGLMSRASIELWTKQFKEVVMVAGNHEFYNNIYEQVLERFEQLDADIENFHFLDDARVVIDGTQFLGSTLWTDMNNQAPEVKAVMNYRMNDYHVIKKDTGTTYGWSGRRPSLKLQVEDTIQFHLNAVKFLEGCLDEFKMPTVIVTHHAPTSGCLQVDRYVGDDMNYAYYTPLEYLMDNDNVKAWISGHTHHAVRLDIYDTQVVSNARGYVGHELNPLFNPLAEISV